MKPSEINLEIAEFAAFCLGDSMKYQVACYDYRAVEYFKKAIIELQTWNRASILDYLADRDYDAYHPNLWDYSRDQALTLLMHHISDAGPFDFLDYAKGIE